MSNEPRVCQVCGYVMDPLDKACKRCEKEGRAPADGAEMPQVRRAPVNPDHRPQPSPIHTYCQKCGQELAPGATLCPKCEGGQPAAPAPVQPPAPPPAAPQQPLAPPPAAPQQPLAPPPVAPQQPLAPPQPVQSVPAPPQAAPHPAPIQPTAPPVAVQQPQPIPMPQPVAPQHAPMPQPTAVQPPYAPLPAAPPPYAPQPAPLQQQLCPNPNCRTPLTPGIRFCARCGTDVLAAVAPPVYAAPSSNEDLVTAVKRLVSNPIGNMREVYEGLAQQRVMLLCGIFAAFYVICVFIASSKIIGDVMKMTLGGLGEAMSSPKLSFGDMIQMAIILLTPVAALALCSLAYRSIAKTGGLFSGDLFIATVSFLPIGLGLLLMSIVGFSNMEIILITFVCLQCFMVILMYAGFVNVSGLTDRVALLCVPLSFIVMAWLTSVVGRMIFENMMKSALGSGFGD